MMCQNCTTKQASWTCYCSGIHLCEICFETHQKILSDQEHTRETIESDQHQSRLEDNNTDELLNTIQRLRTITLQTIESYYDRHIRDIDNYLRDPRNNPVPQLENYLSYEEVERKHRETLLFSSTPREDYIYYYSAAGLRRFSTLTEKEQTVCSAINTQNIMPFILKIPGDKVVLIYGSTKTGCAVNEVFQIDTNTGEVETLPGYNIPRKMHRAIYFKGCIHILGGINQVNEVLSSVEVYRDNQWIDFHPLRGSRCSFGVCVYKNSIYVAGGNKEVNFIERLGTNGFEKLTIHSNLPSECSLADYSGRLMILDNNGVKEIDEETGHITEVLSLKSNGSISTNPVVTDDSIFLIRSARLNKFQLMA